MSEPALFLLEMFVISRMMRGPDKNEPWMAACITGRERLPRHARYFVRRSMSIVCDFVDSRLWHFFAWLEFFGHCDLLVVDERANLLSGYSVAL